MLRSIAPVFLVAPLLAACTRTTSPPAATARCMTEHGPAEPPTVGITYRVLAEDGRLVLAGRTEVSPSHGTDVQTVGARLNGTPAVAAQELRLDARPQEDGAVIVQVRYDESSPNGAKLEWGPSVRVVRGAPVRAETTGGGWSRTIELTAN